MKNLLLGMSISANAVLGYLLLKENGSFEDIESQANNFADKAKGKAQQVKGAVSGDFSDKAEGNFNEAKGEVKDQMDDIFGE
ncbi:CsbD family protein [Lactobacillus sp. S2-2]|uniref:CsbD family protein n=1 Tax=Lactobacillus sp. S2-2 TaxID=2692917 RepID=UPI001F3539F5|nr:CsbD family protein [Lactobacillus sp. S2-2]MCF6515251.1 CsbD family protein [Lactobacillus sp. S2-2]